LLDAGVRGVIASLWESYDGSSTELMTELYALVRTTSPATALAKVQAKWRGRPPREWAGFVCYGDV